MRDLVQRFYRYWGRCAIGTYGDTAPGDPAIVVTTTMTGLITAGCIIALATPARGVVMVPLLSYWGVYLAGNFVVRMIGGLAWRHQVSGGDAREVVRRIQHLSWAWPAAVLFSVVASPVYFAIKVADKFSIGTEQYLLEQVQAPKQLPSKSRTD